MTGSQTPQRIALFPLHTVLFPGCKLPLKIFEQRYLRLVRDCLQHEHGFAVVLISSGREVGDSPEVFTTGCYVDIVDWETLDNGLLGITIQARHRVQVSGACAQHDGLLMADVTELPDDPDVEGHLLHEYPDLVDTLKHLEQHPFVVAQDMEFDYSDGLDLSNKLAHLLPISNHAKQALLESPDLGQRLLSLRSILQELQS